MHSLGPSGTTQADLYTPLRLPVILIGDHKLGGISLTISAFESLRIRGYDVELVLMFREKSRRNYRFLTQYFWSRYRILVGTVSLPPPISVDAGDDEMVRYYRQASALPDIAKHLGLLATCHEYRINRLQSMTAHARERIWFPFEQHKTLRPNGLTVIDSGHGDHFQTVPKGPRSALDALLIPTLDGSASWWTRGLGHGNSKLSLTAAYAAGRYGYVTLAGAVHEPGLLLAETLREGLQNPRISRAFFSDNGSTGIKVACNMALHAVRGRYRWDEWDDGDIEVLGLMGTYHGPSKTIGHMDPMDLNPFDYNVDWHNPKGCWVDYPWVSCMNGQWTIQMPGIWIPDSKDNDTLAFASLHDVFDLDKRLQDPKIRAIYEYRILKVLDSGKTKRRKFGALLMEPIVLGAGGMMLV